MLRRDFILVQIEELGKAIARLFENRNNGVVHKNEGQTEVIYTSLRIEKDFIFSHTADEIRVALDYEDKAGLQRMELVAKTLVEESYLYESGTYLQKAKEIFLYLQQHDNTFSIERVSLLEDIEKRL